MPANAYHFVSQWRVVGSVEEVSDIVDDAMSLETWWGSVYSDVELIDGGNADGLGKSFRLLGHGWLPYTLHLTFRKTEDHYPNGFSVAVSGDLNGSGVWTFTADAPSVNVTFDWIAPSGAPSPARQNRRGTCPDTSATASLPRPTQLARGSRCRHSCNVRRPPAGSAPTAALVSN
jgi:hypothetical protein